MIVIEDMSVNQAGGKVNSLLGASHSPHQVDMYEFFSLIRAFVVVASMYESEGGMVITARIEILLVLDPD